MNSKGKSRPLFWFYLLVAYIVIQFMWWSYLMVQLNNEVYYLKTQVNLLEGESPDEIATKGNELNAKLKARWIMIAGEGSVFVGLMLVGIIQIRKTFIKEAALTQQQNNFLLSVTHELKSPIASAKLQLQTLEKRELDRNKQKEIISNAINDTERLNNLVENILLAAKIENSVYTLHKERVNISQYITENLKRTISSFHYNRKFDFQIEQDIYLDIDKTSFPSILLNLFENAIKYSAEGSTITIELKSRDDKTFFSITDEGIGVANREKELIFQKFYRVGNEETRKTKGTGLGLYITNYLVQQHEGNIVVKNNTPKGSIFEVIFNKPTA
ncbi:MAG TPA: HAMP domain-containing sensor histidine kinase [Bacteroidia bacterium]|nr:HAMP domain-containing sensor histidine kinase [Bacteroidia bacterium]